MNAAGAMAERVYDAIKELVLHGRFRPGARLDPAVLAERLASSVTPVRASLNMLVGEGLVETGTGEGFHVPLIDEPALKDRYAWNAEILGLALRGAQAGTPGLSVAHDTAMPVEKAAALFLGIACRSNNLEHARATAQMNDRLYAVRIAETAILGEVEEELEELANLVQLRDMPQLRRMVARYHRRRIRQAAAILRQLYRMDERPAE